MEIISLKSEKRVISTTTAMRKWSELFVKPLKSQEIGEKSLQVLISKMFWQPQNFGEEWLEEVAKDFQIVILEHQLVDSAAMLMITNPAKFDVIVTENLFGDILSDESSVLPGTLGVMPSASHSDQGPSMYEPIHGSAPDIAGQGIANPISMILSVAMMLRDSFGETAGAEMIEEAVNQTLNQGILTRDLGGQASTAEMTAAIIGESLR